MLDSLSQNRPRVGLSGPLLGRLSVVDAPTGTMRRLAGTMQLQLIDDLGVFIWNLGWCGRKYGVRPLLMSGLYIKFDHILLHAR